MFVQVFLWHCVKWRGTVSDSSSVLYITKYLCRLVNNSVSVNHCHTKFNCRGTLFLMLSCHWWSSILMAHIVVCIALYYCYIRYPNTKHFIVHFFQGFFFRLILIISFFLACLVQRSGWTKDVNIFFNWLSSIQFAGGGFNEAATAEGLAEALMVGNLIFGHLYSNLKYICLGHCLSSDFRLV